ncbi:MAG: universal stress protein [Anaerolineales bacterium]|jgi:nucleotide-binding universal stress UspA family protein
MDLNPFEFRSALEDFRAARQQADLQEIVSRLTGKSNRLFSYDEVVRKLKRTGSSDQGVQQIPLDAILGSVGRYTDFSRTFLPLDDQDRARWARVKAAARDSGMSPIEVYKIGKSYFVLDGNHRVSIARREGMTTIEAHVIEVQTRVPFTPDMQPDELILKTEYADFLEQTRIAELLPHVDLTLTAPGQYAKLKDHIEVHRYFMGLDLKRDISYAEAVIDWCETVYLPIETAIREHGMLRWFPKRSETDLYLWISEHRAELEKQLGWAIRPEAAAVDLAVKESSRAEAREDRTGTWRESRMYDRYTERLFKDILLPVNGSPGSWDAFNLAVVIARREGSHLQGLHIVRSEKEKDEPKAMALLAEFKERLEAAGVAGSLLIEAGDVPVKVCERALLTDLVVLNVPHPPAPGLPGLGSGLRTIIKRCARPLLAACCSFSPMDRALLAFDGSPKAKEALFVATYLAEQWKASLRVVAITDGSRVNASVLDYPRAYLELHEIQAEFISAKGPIRVLNKIMEEHAINLLLMGGYSVSVVEEVVKGSAVNVMLREMQCPIFICR